jgi:1,4-dihydroxy-2-naphthoate octaprenyltransferase
MVSQVAIWWEAARPKTLMAGVCPVLIGSCLAYRDHGWYAVAALAALVGALGIQIGTNYCNDYFDFLQGADTDRRAGPRRAVQAGLVSPAAMLCATSLAFAIVLWVSFFLALRAGWPIFVLGMISVLLGILYTAGRWSLAYLGLGDLFVFVFFGPVAVTGTYFVQTLTVRWPVVISGLAPGLLSVGILVVNNLRDREQDGLVGKRTLAVRFGARFARWEYVLCLILAALIPVVLWRSGEFSPAILAASATLIPGAWLARRMWQRNGADLNPLLGRTAALLLAYTIVFSWGCLFT